MKKPRPPVQGRARRGHVVANNNTNARIIGLVASPPQVLQPLSPAERRANESRRQIRLRNAARMHRRGERPVAEFVDELVRHHPAIADDIDGRLERYAQIDEAVLRALGGDRLPPPPPPRRVEPTTGDSDPPSPPVVGLLGGSGLDSRDAASPPAPRLGFAWGRSPAPLPAMPLPPDVTISLLRASPDLGRPAWDFLRGLDHRRPLTPRQQRVLARLAARRGLGPVA